MLTGKEGSVFIPGFMVGYTREDVVRQINFTDHRMPVTIFSDVVSVPYNYWYLQYLAVEGNLRRMLVPWGVQPS